MKKTLFNLALFITICQVFVLNSAYASGIKWTRIDKKIFYAKVNVYRGNEITDHVDIIKIAPGGYTFRLLDMHDNNGKMILKNVENWQEESGALVVFNGSYYNEEFKPATAVVADGKSKNNFREVKKGAVFVASPGNKSGLAEADIIDLSGNPVDMKNLHYMTAVQSYPVLLDKLGRIPVLKSGWRANRTVIAKDKAGNILLFVTEGTQKHYSFTLYEMAEWIKNCGLGVKMAVNLDGGYESELCIKTNNFSYATYGQWELNQNGDVSKPGLKMWLPFAIAVFPK